MPLIRFNFVSLSFITFGSEEMMINYADPSVGEKCSIFCWHNIDLMKYLSGNIYS